MSDVVSRRAVLFVRLMQDLEFLVDEINASPGSWSVNRVMDKLTAIIEDYDSKDPLTQISAVVEADHSVPLEFGGSDV